MFISAAIANHTRPLVAPNPLRQRHSESWEPAPQTDLFQPSWNSPEQSQVEVLRRWAAGGRPATAKFGRPSHCGKDVQLEAPTRKFKPFTNLRPIGQDKLNETLALLQFANIGGVNGDKAIQDFLRKERFQVQVGDPQDGSPRAYINLEKKVIFLRRGEAVGDRAKSLIHEYLHHAASTSASFVPREFRGEFPRGSEGYYRQHAWIWGESAKVHGKMHKTGGDGAVGFGQSDFFAPIANFYENHTFDEFVKYIKGKGLDLY